jgi:leucyl aminopeptidase
MLPVSFRATATAAKKLPHARIYFLEEGASLQGDIAARDKASGGLITRAMQANAFSGKTKQSLVIHVAEAGLSHVMLLGLGAVKKITSITVEDAAGTAVGLAISHKIISADIVIEPGKSNPLSAKEIAAHAAFGASLRTYRFDKYKTTTKPEDKPTPAALNVVVKDTAAAQKLFTPLQAIAEAIAFTRDIVTEPSNVIYPESLAAECKKLSRFGIKVEVLGEAHMKKLGMGSLLGVGQGSVRESQLVIMQWMGGKKTQKPIALIGKGVTFDTGGISIKPANGMEEMKFDMAGSAAVIGTLRALAARGAKANVVGVVGLVENMPDGNAQRPGDVVTSMSGQTIEVLNTDAEGRLVLADALWYTQQRFKPQVMVDLATLTGAIIVALGSTRAGLFSNNDKVAETLAKAGTAMNEPMWRLPLGDDFDALINTDIADMKNISDGREAGSITAAQFLQRFVNNVPWAHLDIAGSAWSKKTLPTVPKGATAYGVRLLNHWIAENYEA